MTREDMSMRFPSIASVRAELLAINESVDDECDVRLQVYPNGDWAVRFGSSDYDQDHHGFWGCSSVPGDRRRFNATDTAKELLEQCRDHAAQNES